MKRKKNFLQRYKLILVVVDIDVAVVVITIEELVTTISLVELFFLLINQCEIRKRSYELNHLPFIGADSKSQKKHFH